MPAMHGLRVSKSTYKKTTNLAKQKYEICSRLSPSSPISISVSVSYVAVRTIVLSRHGSNLARPVIIHDIIHSLMCMPSTPHCGFSGVSPDENGAYVY